jgi:hypothetical protein
MKPTALITLVCILACLGCKKESVVIDDHVPDCPIIWKNTFWDATGDCPSYGYDSLSNVVRCTARNGVLTYGGGVSGQSYMYLTQGLLGDWDYFLRYYPLPTDFQVGLDVQPFKVDTGMQMSLFLGKMRDTLVIDGENFGVNNPFEITVGKNNQGFFIQIQCDGIKEYAVHGLPDFKTVHLEMSRSGNTLDYKVYGIQSISQDFTYSRNFQVNFTGRPVTVGIGCRQIPSYSFDCKDKHAFWGLQGFEFSGKSPIRSDAFDCNSVLNP